MGAPLALLAFGIDLSVIALIGIVLLIGLVKTNAILIIDFALEAATHDMAPEAAIEAACRLRFRPIMMTTMAALARRPAPGLGWTDPSDAGAPLTQDPSRAAWPGLRAADGAGAGELRGARGVEARRAARLGRAARERVRAHFLGPQTLLGYSALIERIDPPA